MNQTDEPANDRGWVKHVRTWGPAAGWAVVLFLLSAWPDPGGLGRIPISDKVAHVILYAVLGLALGYAWSREPRLIAHTVLIALGALYGVSDEWHQMYVPGRIADVRDWVADVVGLGVGYGAAVAVLGRVKNSDLNTKGPD